MRRRWKRRGTAIALLAGVGLMVIVAVMSFGVMMLWNELMPKIFGLHSIDFWHAAGLLMLSRLLLGGFSVSEWTGRRRHCHWRGGWEQMTPEEKEKFRAGWKNRGGDAPETPVNL